TTASPALMPAAVRANRSASVPLATPTQYWVSQYLAKAFSKSSTIGPPINPALDNALLSTETISSSSSKCGVIRSRKGTGLLLPSALLWPFLPLLPLLLFLPVTVQSSFRYIFVCLYARSFLSEKSSG